MWKFYIQFSSLNVALMSGYIYYSFQAEQTIRSKSADTLQSASKNEKRELGRMRSMEAGISAYKIFGQKTSRDVYYTDWRRLN